MMVYEVLQRSNGRFDYTCRPGSTKAYPLGYCAGWRHDDASGEQGTDSPRFGAALAKDREKALPFKAKYHDDGHVTKKEAKACYHKFCLDQRLIFREEPEVMKRCEVCDGWTDGRALLNQHGSMGPEFILCDEHRNRDGATEALALRKPVEVLINGRGFELPRRKIGFASLVAKIGQPKDATVTYASGKGKDRRSGELARGQILDLEDKMIINVAVTSGA